jgi:hypothetical protein
MGFSDYARDQAKTSLDALVRQLADAARAEIDRLNAAFEARVSALASVIDGVDQGPAVEALVRDLARAATEEAEAAAARAREDARAAADVELAVIKAEGQARLEAETAEKAALTATLDEVRQQAATLQGDLDGLRQRAAALQEDKAATETALAEVEAARAEIEGRLTREQAARADLETTLAVTLQEKKAAIEAARAEAEVRLGQEHIARADLEAALARALQEKKTAIDAARAEAESRIGQGHAALADVEAALAGARRDLQSARSEAQAASASMEALQARLREVEAEKAVVEQARDEVIALLESESPSRMALTEALEEARQSTVSARAEMQARSETLAAALKRVNNAFHAFDDATSPYEVFEIFVAQLAHTFAKVALFFVRDKSLEGALSVGFEPTTTVTNVAIPLAVASPLTRAVLDGAPVLVAADAAVESAGLFGGGGAGAIALPAQSNGRVVAVAYAEEPRSPHGVDADRQLAELIADHVSRCLGAIAAEAGGESLALPKKGGQDVEVARAVEPPAAPSGPARPAEAAPPAFEGPVRQAPRVRMGPKFEVSVDGAAGTLVDLSTSGAQIVTPKSMRPNHAVRIVVPREDGQVRCKGRVVWAALESVRPDGTPLYRAGVKFTEVDGPALEAFLAQQSRAEAGAQRPRAG